MLKTETNTQAMERRVLRAFGRKNARANFEHGQWWITQPNGAQYSVHDATGPGTKNGFCFECVTEGEEPRP